MNYYEQITFSPSPINFNSIATNRLEELLKIVKYTKENTNDQKEWKDSKDWADWIENELSHRRSSAYGQIC